MVVYYYYLKKKGDKKKEARSPIIKKELWLVIYAKSRGTQNMIKVHNERFLLEDIIIIIILEGRRSQTQVRSNNLNTLGEELVSFFSRDRGMNNNIITLLPVTGSSNTVLIT